MSESQTHVLHTILEASQSLRSGPRRWLCTLRSESGTVILIWETEKEPFFLRPMSLQCDGDGLIQIPAEGSGETPSAPGAAT